MRGAVIHAPGDVRFETLDDPKILHPTDAVIRTAVTCVCGSDLWPWRGLEPIGEAARHQAPRPIDVKGTPMRSRLLSAVAAFAVAGCSAPSPDPGASTSRAPQATATAPVSVPTTGDPAVTAARISFTAGDAQVVVRVADNPTSRDLLARLPLTLEFEEFSGREKISYLTEPLTTDGSPGSAPRDGTLIYYKPWDNLGFYYNATGGHDDNLITLGTVESGIDRLDRLEQGPVTVTPLP